ncbi:MAG: His/Gly/Thr/Pro-type tRNA ligase C-terminal domain-containing protein, partial [Patescibacteria group bacterium]
TRGESIGKKIREAQMQKVPYMLIVGKKEVAVNKVAVRSREKGDEGVRGVTEMAQELQEKMAARR